MTAGRTRARTPRRTAVALLAVLILVPVCVVRSVSFYGCVGQVARETSPCCPETRAHEATPGETSLTAASCCYSEEIDLAARSTGAVHELTALGPPAVTLAATIVVPTATHIARPPLATPRATGPPRYLAKQALLL